MSQSSTTVGPVEVGPLAMGERADAMTQPVGQPAPVTPNSILAALLNELVSDLGSGTQIDEAFRSKLERASALANGLETYVDACTTPESEGLGELNRNTAREDWSRLFSDGETSLALEQEMLSGHAEGQLLKILVSAIGAERILEVGMFTGYSTLAMAEALPTGGEVLACELDPYVAEFARRHFDRSPHGSKVQIAVGPAAETLRQQIEHGRPFDFVFIDADKGGYAEYLDLILDGDLLAPNGLLAIDNTLMQGLPYIDPEATPNASAIASFNEKLRRDSRVRQVLVPLRDGVTLVQRIPSEPHTEGAKP